MSVCNSHVQELTLTLNIFGQCNVKHILTSPIKTVTPVLKILTYIITSITAGPVELAAILAIMSVSTLKTAIILYGLGLMMVLFKTNNDNKLYVCIIIQD